MTGNVAAHMSAEHEHMPEPGAGLYISAERGATNDGSWMHEVAHSVPAEDLDQYRDDIYEEMGKIARLPLPDKAVSGITSNFGGWKNGVRRVRGIEVKYLSRIGDNSLIDEKSLKDDQQRRLVLVSEGIVTIIAKQLTGDDIRLMIDIDRQAGPAVRRKPKHRPEELPDLAVRFRCARKERPHKDVLFSELEELMLGLTTEAHNMTEIAAKIETSPPTVSRIMKPIMDRCGVDTYDELTLVAIALGVAKTDHIDETLIDRLTDMDKTRIAKIYSRDPQDIKDVSKVTRGTIDTWQYRARNSMGAKNRREVMLCGAKSGLVDLPDPEQIKRNVVEYDKNNL